MFGNKKQHPLNKLKVGGFSFSLLKKNGPSLNLANIVGIQEI